MRNWILIGFTVLFLSCGDDQIVIPDDVIQKEDFTDIMFEVEIVDALHTQNIADKEGQDLVTLSHYKQIFDDFDITETEFTYSYSFYEKHPELMLEIIDSLSHRFILLEDSISHELNKAKWRRKKR